MPTFSAGWTTVSGGVIAWLVMGIAGLSLAALLYAATPSWGRWRYLVVGVVLAWSLTPYRFDGEHQAPAFAVAVFRLFLEEGLDPKPPLLALGVVTAIVTALYCAVLGVWALTRFWRDRHRL